MIEVPEYMTKCTLMVGSRDTCSILISIDPVFLTCGKIAGSGFVHNSVQITSVVGCAAWQPSVTDRGWFLPGTIFHT